MSLIERKKERKSVCQSVEQRYYEIHIRFLQYDVDLRFVLTYMGLLLQDKARKATGMQIDATGDDYGDPDLFSISVIKVSCFSISIIKVSCLFLWSCYVLCLLSGITCPQNLY